jgi:two-component system, chemotaxis family, sensor kinase Cph1
LQFLKEIAMSSAVAEVASFIQRSVNSVSEKDLDSLPYGVIQVDAEGVMLRYNAFEAGLSGLSKKKVVGKNFFTQIAPCTDLQEFRGRFREGIAAGKLQCTFRYHFAFRPNPRDVTVTLFYNQAEQIVWILVQPDR